jgi:hypothetical protein
MVPDLSLRANRTPVALSRSRQGIWINLYPGPGMHSVSATLRFALISKCQSLVRTHSIVAVLRGLPWQDVIG